MAGVAPQNLTVSKIKSRLLNVAQTSLYRLTLSLPPRVDEYIRFNVDTYNVTDTLENINLLCTDASLPGSSLATHEVTNDYHGVTERMAYRRIYDESLALTFYVDRDYNTIKVFEAWIDYISGVRSTVEYASPYVHTRNTYPRTYKNNIFLTKFERDHHYHQENLSNKNTLDYTFVDAFPRDITAIPVTYSGSDALKCTVNFSYIRYIVEKGKDQWGTYLQNTGGGIDFNAIAN